MRSVRYTLIVDIDLIMDFAAANTKSNSVTRATQYSMLSNGLRTHAYRRKRG